MLKQETEGSENSLPVPPTFPYPVWLCIALADAALPSETALGCYQSPVRTDPLASHSLLFSTFLACLSPLTKLRGGWEQSLRLIQSFCADSQGLLGSRFVLFSVTFRGWEWGVLTSHSLLFHGTSLLRVCLCPTHTAGSRAGGSVLFHSVLCSLLLWSLTMFLSEVAGSHYGA